MVVMPIESAKFAPVFARLPDGAQMSVLWGNSNTGPSAVLLEMRSGPLDGTVSLWRAPSRDAAGDV